jgi:hypothetical protein
MHKVRISGLFEFFDNIVGASTNFNLQDFLKIQN